MLERLAKRLKALSSRGIVTLKKGQWVIENLQGDFTLFGYCKDGRVVGNIFDNEELLKHTEIRNFIALMSLIIL